MPPAKRQFNTLHGFRGIAAIMVVLYHFLGMEIGYENWAYGHGYLAVDFFFLLSGFVLSESYEQRLRGTWTAKNFIVVRIIRLYPMYIIGCVGGLAYYLTVGKHTIDFRNSGTGLGFAAFTSQALMLPSPPPLSIQLFALNPPAWSLFFELSINVAFALWLRVCGGLSPAWICLASGLLWLGVVATGHDMLGGNLWHNALLGVPRCGFSFFLGVAVRHRYHAGLHKVSVNPLLLGLLLIVLLSVPVGFSFTQWYDAAFIAVLAPALVYLAIQNEPGTRVTGTFAFLGTISYPLYAVHYPILWSVISLCKQHAVGAGGMLAVECMTMALLLGLAWKMEKLYDIPVRRVLSAAMSGSISR